MAVNVPNEPSARDSLPESLRQPPLEDVGTEGRWPSPLASSNDVLQLAEVFLPDTSTALVAPFPLGVIVVGVPLKLLGFEPFHRRLLGESATMIGDRMSDFKLKLKGKNEERVRA